MVFQSSIQFLISSLSFVSFQFRFLYYNQYEPYRKRRKKHEGRVLLMNEVKRPKKPLIFYYIIALLILFAINLFAVPSLFQRQIKEVDYGTFISMTENKDIGAVEIQDNQIVFTDADNENIYKTGIMDDPQRTQRLYDAGAKFSSEIVQEASPFVTFLVSWVLPILCH